MTEKELFLTALLDCKRQDLYINNIQMDRQQENQLSSMFKRRLNGEPVQYITGFTEFMGFPFKVDERVLIPRPETEILVEQVLNLIKDISSNQQLNVLDLCTGSGNIAISLTKLSKNLKVVASDISDEALQVCRENAKINQIEDRVVFFKSDLFNTGFKDKENFFDVIICNPPYLTVSELDNASADLVFEPRIALDAGDDGILFYREILKQSPRYLKKKGFLIFEIGHNQLEKIKDLLKISKEFSLEKIIKDYSQIDRVIFLRKND